MIARLAPIARLAALVLSLFAVFAADVDLGGKRSDDEIVLIA